MGKKRLIDATDLVRRVLVERDKIPLTVIPRYNFGVPEPFRQGQAMRGGIRKALREIETSPTVEAVEVIRCKDCIHSVLLKDAWFKSECPWRYYRNDCRFCSCVELVDSEPLLVDDDFFCKFGERKMDAEVE